MDETLRNEIEALYRRLDAELAEHRPRCELSGRCCDFEKSGLDLFASSLEVDYARAGAPAPEAPSGRCPWHVDGLCRLREGRPLGCRVYFCDPAWAERMPETYERYHRELVALHDRHGLLYRYGRFVDAVREP